MRLAIITSNNFFGESLKSLLENYNFKNDIYLTLKGFSLDNIEELDVIVSDYKFEQFKYFLKKNQHTRKENSRDRKNINYRKGVRVAAKE